MAVLRLVGTGHVFRIGPAVRDAVAAWAPQVVFVELDVGRYRALVARRAGAPRPKAGFVQRRLEAFQEGVAGMYGAQVGEEMLAAVDGARDVGAQVRFIDPPAEDTLRKALSEVTWREKARGVGLVVRSALGGLVRRRGREDVEAEIARYQADPASTLAEMQAKFPTVHRVLIDERDDTMAQRIVQGLSGRQSGVAVVGDGHVPGLMRRLEAAGIELEVYRLADVRSGRLPKPGNSVYRFGFDARTGPVGPIP